MPSTTAPEQHRALLLLVDGIVESVRAAGDLGVPGGVLYAALMAHGCSLEQFEGLMSALVGLGKLRRSGDLYFAR
jgi:hypothetical protein